MTDDTKITERLRRRQTPNGPDQGRALAEDRQAHGRHSGGAAAKKPRRLKGANQLPRVIEGVISADGVVKADEAQTRAA